MKDQLISKETDVFKLKIKMQYRLMRLQNLLIVTVSGSN